MCTNINSEDVSAFEMFCIRCSARFERSAVYPLIMMTLRLWNTELAGKHTMNY